MGAARVTVACETASRRYPVNPAVPFAIRDCPRGPPARPEDGNAHQPVQRAGVLPGIAAGPTGLSLLLLTLMQTTDAPQRVPQQTTPPP
jgi:hypothetical protein